MTQSVHQASTPADLDNAATDRLALAIDKDYLLPRMQEQWRSLAEGGYRLDDCVAERVHPRADGGFIIDYQLSLVQGGVSFDQPVSGQLPLNEPEQHYRNAVVSLQKSRRGQLSKNIPSHRIGLLNDPGLVMRFAGLDEKIDGLGMVRSPGQLHRDLADAARKALTSVTRIDLLAHRLHRRAVIRLGGLDRYGDPASLIVKFYKKGSARGARNIEIARFLRASSFGRSSSVNVPEPLDNLPEWSAFIMEDVPGTPICELRREAQPSGMGLAGEALGRLHRVPLRIDAKYTPDNELALLERWISVVSSVWPDQERHLRERMAKVSRLLNASRSFDPVCIHRDFHDKQVLAHGDTGHLIDFDTVCIGDPAQDVGNFLAHLDLAQLQGVSDAETCADSFLEGYERNAPDVIRSNQQAHRASTLLRLACLYAFSAQWRCLTPGLLELI